MESGGEGDLELVSGVLDRIAANVALLVDREISVSGIEAERAHERPAGRSSVHISFKLLFNYESGEDAHGCVLVPLPDAISLACYLMMFTEEEVEFHRRDEDLDRSTKDAMLELGNFIGAAVDEALRASMPKTSVRAAGCQGVRADVRPALIYEEGGEILVGRASVKVHEFPDFKLIMVLPSLALSA